MSESKRALVSLVVPVYNSEKYLERCLECIVGQNYPNIEVIVVDGGSTDGTAEILEKFEKKYDVIRCIYKENEGVSSSRNRGMEAARGKYLEFVDSDDFLLPNACETLVKAMEETGADVVTAGFVSLKNGEERRPVKAVYDGPDAFAGEFGKYYTYKKNCINVPWNKMYRLAGLTARFPEGLSMGEDLLFNLQVFGSAGRIAFIPDLVYEYNNRNEESLAYRYREDGFEIETMLYRKVTEFVTDHGGNCPEVLRGNYLFGIKSKLTALVHKSGLSPSECQKKIRGWTEQQTLRELAGNPQGFGKKDKILLFMLRRHMKRGLYWYYRWMA